jgi:predicted phage terminase large subunit-like protein
MPFARTSSLSGDNLSEADKQLLVSALTEMQKRGIKLENVLQGKSKLIDPNKKDGWNKDESGWFMGINDTHFVPSKKQEDFIRSRARYVALVSGRGGGKTAAGAQKAMLKIEAGESGTVINPDFENFKFSTWSEFRNWIDWTKVVRNQRYRSSPEWMPHQPFTLVFTNGAKVYCKGLKDPNSARGANVNWLWYDEGGRDNTGQGWRIANASVRIGVDAQSWTTATPRGTDHWLYKFFVMKEMTVEVEELLKEAIKDRDIIELFYTSIDDNKDNLSPDFYASMMANYPVGWLREQELEGKFVDEGTSMGDRGWFLGKVIPMRLPDSDVKGRVRYWDMAASEKKLIGKTKMSDPDHTCGTLLAQSTFGSFYIEDQVSAQVAWGDIKRMIVDTALMDGTDVPIYIEQEGGSGGINQIAEIATMPELNNYVVRMHNPRDLGDKVMRAQSWFSRAALGLIFLVKGKWNEDFLQQLSNFPASKHDDLVDSVSGCFAVLAPAKKWSKPSFLSVRMYDFERRQ